MTMILRPSLDGNVPHGETEKYAWCELESDAPLLKIKTLSEYDTGRGTIIKAEHTRGGTMCILKNAWFRECHVKIQPI